MYVHAPQRGNVHAVAQFMGPAAVQAGAQFLGPDIAYQVRRAVGVAVDVTVETGDAAAGQRGTAVFGLIELLLRERRYQEAQAFELFRVQNAIEQFVVIHQGDYLALGHIAQVGPGRQVKGGRIFGQ